MKALLLKNYDGRYHRDDIDIEKGTWLDVDTSSLSDNGCTCYYGNRRVFLSDEYIARIIDDVREGKGRCKYCGFQGTEEEVFEHFKRQAELSKHCEMCKYWKFAEVDEKVDEGKEPLRVNVSKDEYQLVSTKHIVKTFKKKCTSYWGCGPKECTPAMYEPIDSQFTKKPFGVLFDDFKYSKNIKDGVLKIENFYNSYILELTLDTGMLKLYNSRSTYEFPSGIKLSHCREKSYYITSYTTDWHPMYGSKYSKKMVYRKADKELEEFLKELNKYNEIVGDDCLYKNPDGTDCMTDDDGNSRPKVINFRFGL